ncbi:type 4a pilus biogenesis protein PilO [Desulfurobacterium atlanticum]|uniref:Type IV pilus assembly protein PilO n=1 Tax=Desulfurobacterium atlanticum TaxID=240169 RepID=A0A238Z6D0_9BACT|nr:type 4a pilus biogenesis protein PilO [Desulfurobacterium atlanticum]SNR78609.1 type IV pilus assembly protein PilO [Desulfurobacterium atlanticum]
MAFEGLIDDLKERWAEIPKWQKWIGYLILLFVVAFVYKMNVIDPINQKIAILSNQVNRKKARVAKLKLVEKRRDILKKEISKLEEEISKLEAKLPTGKEDVSNIIKSVAQDTGTIRIDLIQRGREETKKYYTKIGYSVVMSTRYPNFIKWCEHIVSAKRVLTIGDLSMVALDPVKKKVEERTDDKTVKKEVYLYPYTVQVNMQINAYMLKR